MRRIRRYRPVVVKSKKPIARKTLECFPLTDREWVKDRVYTGD